MPPFSWVMRHLWVTCCLNKLMATVLSKQSGYMVRTLLRTEMTASLGPTGWGWEEWREL